jgi:hypothetical protein
MERAVYKYTYNCIFEHSPLMPYQSGFIHGHSTVYQLIEMDKSQTEAVASVVVTARIIFFFTFKVIYV